MTSHAKCAGLRSALSSYMDGILDAKGVARVESHVRECAHCRSLLTGMQNVARLAKDPRLLPLPGGFAGRLQANLRQCGAAPAQAHRSADVPMGITPDLVPVGSHLIYFWQTPAEFKSGVRFLHPGLGKDEHCIIFGHDEALSDVQNTLRSDGYDPEALKEQGKLTVLRRHAAAGTTLGEISQAVEKAMAAGATLIRFLGNLGLGRDPLPAGEDDVLELERRATSLLEHLPCIIVCMYDVRTVPGRLIFKGGLETHSLSVNSEGVQHNPFYVDGHVHAPRLVQ